MRHKILLSSFAAFITFAAAGQKQQNIAFAITSPEKGAFQWSNVRLIDLGTGEVVRTIFDGRQPFSVYNARTGRELTVKDAQGVVKDLKVLPFHSMSAALAYDKRHNRLYYTPMGINQLRYIDLSAKQPRIYYFENENLSAATVGNNEASHITRMVIAADGKGYAVSNDGKHFIRFGTGRKPAITDLGSLTDDPKNTISIHEKQTSWGGDMVADAFGNLYIISAFHNVFKVNIHTKTATHVGKIEGLPGNFTANGAVIDDEGRLVVSSASSTDGYYAVDLENWKATRLPGTNVFNASDMASGNLAFEPKMESARLLERQIVRNDKITLYPNPVSTGRFRITFNNRESGRYDVQVVDMNGTLISAKNFRINSPGQVAEVDLRTLLASGIYLVKVLNYKQKVVFANKLMVAN